jgi:beta-lactamase regulating signal transducer with metallopeptidase domain
MLDLTVRSTLLLAAAFLVVATLRRAPAAARHLVWATALAGLLVLPALPAVVPSWTIAVPAAALPSVAGVRPPEAQTPSRVATAAPAEAAPAEAIGPTAEGVTTERTPIVRARTDGSTWLWWALWSLWGLGAALVISRVGVGMWRLHSALRATQLINDPAWTALADRVAHRFGVGRPIGLHRGSAGVVPVTSGILRPVIILPADADDWDLERRRLVLTHEIAHVRRLDVLTHIVGQIAVALFWFHPLVWVAAARMRLERERACDDLVLAAGVRPSRYAEDLLELAQTLGGESVPAAAALAMARRTELEGRLLAILDGAISRRPLGWPRIASAMAVAAVAIVALAVVRPVPARAASSHESVGHRLPGARAEEVVLADSASAAAGQTSEIVKRRMLLAVALHHSTSDTVRRALFNAMATVRADSDRRTILLGSLGRGTSDDATVAEVVRATMGMTSDADRSAVLLAVLGELRARTVGRRADIGDHAIAQLSIASAGTLTSTAAKTRVLREVVRGGWLTKGDVQRRFKICVAKA